jgi:hypothetical protein
VLLIAVCIASIYEGTIYQNFENVNVFVTTERAGVVPRLPTVTTSLVMIDTACADVTLLREAESVKCDVAPLDRTGRGVGCLVTWRSRDVELGSVLEYGFATADRNGSLPTSVMFSLDSFTPAGVSVRGSS